MTLEQLKKAEELKMNMDIAKSQAEDAFIGQYERKDGIHLSFNGIGVLADETLAGIIIAYFRTKADEAEREFLNYGKFDDENKDNTNKE